MGAQPQDYRDGDPEKALKYAVRRVRGDRAQIIEPVSPSWDLDRPGTSNWYVPDIAVVPRKLAKGGEALLPDPFGVELDTGDL